MIDTDMFVRMAAGDAETPTLFPYPLPFHIIFALLATVFFIFRFVKDRKPFQLIFAIAIPFSLTLHINATESRTLFYVVGAVELLLVLAALVSVFLYKGKPSPAKAGEAAGTDSADSEKVSEASADTETTPETNEVPGEADGE